MRLPARDAPNKDLDDDRPMDEDELLNYADQEPLHLPTPSGELGPIEQFLLDMPDFSGMSIFTSHTRAPNS